MKFQSKLIHFHSRKSIWKCHPENGGHFVSASMCWELLWDVFLPLYEKIPSIFTNVEYLLLKTSISNTHNNCSLSLTHCGLVTPFGVRDLVTIGSVLEMSTVLWRPQSFNSLWPSDAIWRQGSRSTLVQVMASCLTAPSQYLNQCWLIITKVPWC